MTIVFINHYCLIDLMAKYSQPKFNVDVNLQFLTEICCRFKVLSSLYWFCIAKVSVAISKKP